MLEIKNLKTEFRTDEETVTAVNGISFSLNKGETVGIVGESGSGKSVTSLSVMRLISSPGKISEGEIFFTTINGNQHDLLKLSEKEMRHLRGKELAMIFQEPMTSLNPVFTCGNQVAETLIVHQKISRKEAKEKTIELFEKVKLPRAADMYSAYPHEISGGQKQRVMIAMAISCDPSLLIADEPTTALDVTVQSRILQLLRELKQEKNMGMLFISHDLGVIGEIANRVVVMYRGKIVEEGPVKEILNNPKHPYTIGLIACRPPLHYRPAYLPVISDIMTEKEDGTLEQKISIDETKFYRDNSEERKNLHEKIYSHKPVLEVKNIKVHFPVRSGVFGKISSYVKAVDDVSFTVYPGETLGLVGESGCGKTTLGRAIIRLLEPTSGEVIFKNIDFASLEGGELRRMRKNIQIIFQDPYSSLNPRMTIGEAILEPMQVHHLHGNNSKRKAQVLELLNQVGMKAEHYNRYPHEFSGGQRQRICIARALALEPEFIICDESVSALDVSVQAQVLNLLNKLKKDFGLTYIFISHDLSVVKYMSDRMMVMNQGKIEELGDPDVIYAKPASEYTRSLIRAIPGVEKVKS